ncbi:hypothetical protein [Sulfitobacter noctilucae]|uniref:hypothetical protein n=1 Tax=Sulfitobacter noctilucae TaxID=1342302 RepID=UPI00046A50D2|nr:hypothetical protein [Sulfitobacter noctilucae]
MTTKLKRFCKDTSGAVTVDWIVLTAAVVALAAMTVTVLQSGSEGLAENTGDFMIDQNFF